MSANTPDDLTPAQRQQYINNYITGKLARGEIPRSPAEWLRANEFWQKADIQGKAFEKGLDVLLHLPEQGYEAHKQFKDKSTGKSIFVDRHLPEDKAKDDIAVSLEAKTGTSNKDRLIDQLIGYRARLEAGDKVLLYIPKDRVADQPKAARQLIELMKRDFPEKFILRTPSPKATQRILDAGMKVVQREAQQKLEQNLARLPAERDPIISVKDFAKSITKDIREGREVSLAELRAAHEMLNDIAGQQRQEDLDTAAKNAKELGKGFRDTHSLEQHQFELAKEKNSSRMVYVDAVTVELHKRQREEIERDVKAVNQQAAEALAQGKPIDHEALAKAHLTLGNALDGVTREEDRWLEGQAADLDKQAQQAFLSHMVETREDRDRELHARIALIGQEADRIKAEREASAKAVAERAAHAQAMEARWKELRDLGVSEQVIKISGLGQVPLTPAQEAQLRASREARDSHAPEVQRGGRAAERDGRERGGQGRDRW
ncbi:hypothetical protein OH799_25335 [Nocardia sp. NBC_00881]|uniref:hypothetical protein n=1 Tax=Nocardia sp. NBC_00881 TaxID=2975995 RepID=UPI00386B534C|nr:hypothetical protein OH799_25335 [Nocardia sp. NBC_00881]